VFVRVQVSVPLRTHADRRRTVEVDSATVSVPFTALSAPGSKPVDERRKPPRVDTFLDDGTLEGDLIGLARGARK
jgi:hypothetical protein